MRYLRVQLFAAAMLLTLRASLIGAAAEPEAETRFHRPRLQIINGGNSPIDVFWLKTPRRTYWFSFHELRWREGDYIHEGAYIVPDIDPKRAARMDDYEVREDRAWIRRAEPIAFDTFSPEFYAWGVPSSGNPSPALIFARGLGPLLWREPHLLTLGEGEAEQEEMPLGMFELAACDPAPH